jgi:hypothetical protein
VARKEIPRESVDGNDPHPHHRGGCILASGGLKAYWLLIASIPVSAVHPAAKARK